MNTTIATHSAAPNRIAEAFIILSLISEMEFLSLWRITAAIPLIGLLGFRLFHLFGGQPEFFQSR